MPAWILNWLQTASWLALSLAFLVENLIIFLLVIVVGDLVATRFSARRVSLTPAALTWTEIVVALVNVLFNTATTVAGLFLWRKGIIKFRTDVGLRALLDVLVLLVAMDLLMYVLHRTAHTRLLYPILHQFHHRYDRPRPLNLFALSPVENLAFGGLWLAFISVYHASWAGMSAYLFLNVLFGAVGHLGVEPLPQSWVRHPVLKYVAGGSFHVQHHQDMKHNFGFYTLIWDRLWRTVRPDYAESFGTVPSWLKK